MRKKFGILTFEQILYHIQFGAEGLLNSDPDLIKSFKKNCIIYPIIISSIVVCIDNFLLSMHINRNNTKKNIF